MSKGKSPTLRLRALAGPRHGRHSRIVFAHFRSRSEPHLGAAIPSRLSRRPAKYIADFARLG